MNDDRIPNLSIGLPVYNGSDHLEIALESILKQDYTDYELIISDNASTDNTEEICRAYAAQDQRIRYIRRDKNYGLINNGLFTASLARSELFMPASHDDQCLPGYISKCVKPFASNPNLGMAVPGMLFVNPDYKEVQFSYPPLHTVGLDIRSRVALIFTQCNVGNNIYGIYKKTIFDKLKAPALYGTDVIMLLQLMFLAEVQYIPDILFKYRISFRQPIDQVREIDPELGEKMPVRNYTVMTINLLRVIMQAPIDSILKQILISDAIEIIALKNLDWRNIILHENPNLASYIIPDRNGCLSMAEANLVSVFSSYLLSYAYKSLELEGIIVFDDFQEFSPQSHSYPAPIPGHKEFIETITLLVENNKNNDAVNFYNKYRNKMPETEHIRTIDHLLKRLKSINTVVN